MRGADLPGRDEGVPERERAPFGHSSSSVAEQLSRSKFHKCRGPRWWIGVSPKPVALEQVPVIDLVQCDRPLCCQRQMPLASLAHVGVAFHHHESSPRMSSEIAQTQAVNGRKPERIGVDHERNRRGVGTTVGPRGSENAIQMSARSAASSSRSSASASGHPSRKRGVANR